MQYFTKKSHLCFIMCEQPIALSLVNIELWSKMSLHCITLKITYVNWDNPCSKKGNKKDATNDKN